MTDDKNGNSKQPLRRAAIERAQSWARDLRLNKNPHAKSVLLALTTYVNGEGVCFPAVDTLASVTEISSATVRRRLDFLVSIGAIKRRSQWLDGYGARSSRGRGKRTSDEIRLLLDADVDEIERRAMNFGCAPEPTNSVAISCPHSISDRETDGVRPLAAPRQPSQYCNALITEPEPKESPLTPLEGDLSVGCPIWEEFATAWGEPIARYDIAEEVWSELAAGERYTALKAAAAYVVRQRSKRAPPTLMSAQTFLREKRGWTQWLSPIGQTIVTTPTELIFEAEGSTPWRARWVIAEIAGTPKPTAVDGPEGRGGRFVPLSSAHLPLARFADVAPTTWSFVPANEPLCDAWCDFLNIEPRPIVVRTRTNEINGRIIKDWPVKHNGLRVPCAYPPANCFLEEHG
jgi:hypothetical protein